MKQEKQRTERSVAGRKTGTYLLYYSLLFAIISAGVFIWFLIEHRSFCWTADSSPQYVPKVIYYIKETKEFLRSLMQGEWNFKMYDFQLGLGDAVPLHMEPVYWLYLLFGESRIELAYGALILLRYYLAGLSMSVFLRYFCCTGWECLIGSMVYVFSGYGLFAGMQHSHFIIPMITLPVLLLAMEEIYRQKRWYLCTLFVALSFWCGYYFTYMNTILMGCYFLIRFFFGEEERSIKRFLLRMRTIICSYLLGIGIANITFFTTFAGYLTSSRTGGGAIQTVKSLWHYGPNFTEKAWQSFLVTGMGAGSWLRLGFTALSYLAIVLLFLRRGKIQLKIGFLLGTMFCLVPFFGYVFSGFGTITNRWCYGYAFVVAVITARMSGELKKLSKKELIFMGIAILPYAYYGIGKKLLGMTFKKATLWASILLILTYLLIVLLNCRKKLPQKLKSAAVLCNLVVLLWASGLMFFHSGFGNMISEFTKSGTVISKATDTPLKVMDEVEDPSFYRSYARQASATQGASMVLGYNGVEYFNSTIAGPTIDFYREMGLTSWTLVKLMGFDERGYLDTLGNVKYMVMKEGKEFPVPYGFTEVKEILRDEVYYKVFENQNVLPLGYTYDQVISLEDLEKIETPYRQEVMLQAAVVDDPEKVPECQNVEENQKDTVQINGQKVEITDIQCDENVTYDGSTIKATAADATMTIYFDGLEDSETYLYLRGLDMKKKKASLYFQTDEEKETQSYVVKGDASTYNTRQEEFIINLGYGEEKKQFCKIRFGQKTTLHLEDLAIYCQPMSPLTDYVAERKADSLENVEMDTNRITGTVAAQKDELMVFSIPYQSGWSAYVDGVKTKMIRANIMYMGISIPQGEHSIELRYEMPGLRISLMITAVSLVSFICAMAVRKHRKGGRVQCRND